jgi:hypothetical protein
MSACTVVRVQGCSSSRDSNLPGACCWVIEVLRPVVRVARRTSRTRRWSRRRPSCVRERMRVLRPESEPHVWLGPIVRRGAIESGSARTRRCTVTVGACASPRRHSGATASRSQKPLGRSDVVQVDNTRSDGNRWLTECPTRGSRALGAAGPGARASHHCCDLQRADRRRAGSRPHQPARARQACRWQPWRRRRRHCRRSGARGWRRRTRRRHETLHNSPSRGPRPISPPMPVAMQQ